MQSRPCIGGDVQFCGLIISKATCDARASPHMCSKGLIGAVPYWVFLILCNTGFEGIELITRDLDNDSGSWFGTCLAFFGLDGVVHGRRWVIFNVVICRGRWVPGAE